MTTLSLVNLVKLEITANPARGKWRYTRRQYGELLDSLDIPLWRPSTTSAAELAIEALGPHFGVTVVCHTMAYHPIDLIRAWWGYPTDPFEH